MSRTTPTTSGRRTSVVAFAVFVTLLVLPGTYQLLYGFRGGELARWRGWLDEGPRTADALRKIESDLDARFFLATTIRNWKATFVPAGPVMLADVRVGRDGWLFLGVDAQVPRAAGFLDRRLDRPTQAIAALAQIDAMLRARGIHFVVAPVPSKASIYPDKLDAPGDAPDLNVDHRAWFAALRARGVDALDLVDPLWAERAAERDDLARATFTATDSHWTWHGIDVAARTIAARAEPFLRDAPRAEFRRVTLRRSRPTDLFAEGVRRDVDAGDEERAFLLDAAGRTARADDPDAGIIVLGDSFAATMVDEGSGLPQAIAHATGVSTRSAAVYGGSVYSMRRQLLNPETLTPRVRVVVFTFALRHLITTDWPLIDDNPPWR